MNNSSTLQPLQQATLTKCADRLEASLTVIHSSAYPDALSAVRLMRWLTDGTAHLATLDREMLPTLTMKLRKFAATVSNPAAANLTASADALDSVAADNKDNRS